jgi:hypothetical protein
MIGLDEERPLIHAFDRFPLEGWIKTRNEVDCETYSGNMLRWDKAS